MKVKRAIILLACFLLLFCGLAIMSTYGDIDNAANYANKASNYASDAAGCASYAAEHASYAASYANEAYHYARKAYRSDTLKETQYYAKKAMDAAEDIQSMAIHAQLAADSAESECYQ